jgi:hypothetical protein
MVTPRAAGTGLAAINFGSGLWPQVARAGSHPGRRRGPLSGVDLPPGVVETRSCSTKRTTSPLTAPTSARRRRKPVLICSSDLYAV